jgi:hypothetical protein
MSTPSIIGFGTLRSGQLMCVATERTHNSVHVFDGNAWRKLVRWAGHEATAACACGDTVVCAALDDVVYLVDGTTVSRVALPKQGDWIYAAAALSEDTALLGGSGGLVLVSTRDQSVTRRRLSEFNVSRPGRHILGIARTASRVLLLGKKNLVVDYKGNSAAELIGRKALGSEERFFQDAVELDQDLWLSGMSGPHPFLARMVDGGLHDEPIPVTRQTSPSLAVLGSELVIGAERLWAGKPGQWREVLALTPGASIVGLTPAPATAPHPLCAFTSDGISCFTDGRAHTQFSVL